MKEYPKAYSPSAVEDKWYGEWIDNEIFTTSDNSEKPPYSILMPPPNVTGILHFGHMLNLTIQDLYIRYKRMCGFESCWFPGTDHAGIATQARVEKQLKQEGLTRYDLGRDKFVEKVWEWREKYGDIILAQMRKLGVSCDWERTIFTMDDGPSNAVKHVFIQLFDDGLIYKGKRIINWSPVSQTALSDEEVEFREVKEFMYTLRYYFEDGENYLKVSTVRPETIFGDIAVAVNPNDERFKDKIGRKVQVPLVGRWVEIIADDYADPEFGTGCVKITPAHDPNDFLVGERHSLEMINTINPDGTLNELTGEFNGVDRFEVRKMMVNKLKELDLVEKIDDYTHNVGFSQRGGEPVEPYLSDQWFVKMKPLTEQALEAVQSGEVKFHPEHWVKTYEHWMKNIRDWCISRQLWWGHRIPVYYTPDGNYTAAANETEARQKLGIDSDVELKQETDVLDTWFSSWLWPMTTMSWKADGKADETATLNKFLPTDLLVTAPDIIFFWVSRMIMASKYFKQEIPFKDVYFTSTIRDGLGRKLSKSLGNSPDPLNIIDKYGADAVRFTMLYLSPLGQDVKLDVDVKAQDIQSIEIGRNFCNKIWNSGRFMMMKLEQALEGSELQFSGAATLQNEELSVADKWILSRLNSTIKTTQENLDNFKVTEFAKNLYEFIWRDFCDWYIEILKVQLRTNDDKKYQLGLMKFAFGIFESILKLIHPVMPFISEEIWHILNEKGNKETISMSEFPEAVENSIDKSIEARFESVQMVVEELRKLKSGTSIPPSQPLPASISIGDDNLLKVFELQAEVIKTLAKCSEIKIGKGLVKPDKALASVVREIQIYLEIGSAIDFDKERERINKEIARLEGNIRGSEKKLSNEKFINNAAPEIVNREREKLASMKESLDKVRENLKSLG
jgi:valyl-tRNA synthetase